MIDWKKKQEEILTWDEWRNDQGKRDSLEKKFQFEEQVGWARKWGIYELTGTTCGDVTRASYEHRGPLVIRKERESRRIVGEIQQ